MKKIIIIMVLVFICSLISVNALNITSIRIDPTPEAFSNENLSGYVNGTGATYNYYDSIWYKNYVQYKNYTVNISTIFFDNATSKHIYTDIGLFTWGGNLFLADENWTNASYLTDNNFSTYGVQAGVSGGLSSYSFIELNYTLPSNPGATSYITYRMGNTSSVQTNITIPQRCLNRSELSLLVGSVDDFGVERHWVECLREDNTGINIVNSLGYLIYELDVYIINTTSYANNTEVLLDTIMFNETSPNDEWVFSSRLYNGTAYSNWTNSTITTIRNVILNITYYDIDTLNKLTGTNVSVEIIGANTINNWTNTSNIIFNLNSSGWNTILSESSTYRQNQYNIFLQNEQVNLNIYLDKTNTTSLALITVKDKYSKDPIINADVTIQRYTSGWVTDQILRTDFNGQTEGYFIVSTVFYNFLVSVDGVTYFGVINSNENKKTIYAEDITNGIIVEIDTSPSDEIVSYQNTYSVATSISFTNTSNLTGYFTFFWDDSDNQPQNTELVVKLGNTQNCSEIGTTESGSVTCYVNTTVSAGVTTFTAIGYVNGVPVESSIGSIGVDAVLNFRWGATGWFIGLFLVIIGFTLFLSAPKISVLIGSGVFTLLVIFNVILGRTETTVAVLIFFMGFMLTKIPRKEGE